MPDTATKATAADARADAKDAKADAKAQRRSEKGEKRVPYWDDVAPEPDDDDVVADVTNYFTMSEFAAEALPDGVEPDPAVIVDTKAIREEQRKLTEEREEAQEKAAERTRARAGIHARV